MMDVTTWYHQLDGYDDDDDDDDGDDGYDGDGNDGDDDDRDGSDNMTAATILERGCAPQVFSDCSECSCSECAQSLTSPE